MLTRVGACRREFTRGGACLPIFARVYEYLQVYLIEIPTGEGERLLYHVVHVQIAIEAEPSAEDDIFPLLRKAQIPLIASAVGDVADGIEPFPAQTPCLGVLVGDHGTGGGTVPVEMLVLDDARIGHRPIGIVDDRRALEVLHGQAFGVEAQRAVFERSVAVTEVFVDGARKEHAFGEFFERAAVGREIAAEPHFRPFQHPFDHGRVAACGDALIAVVEVVVVVGEAQRQALDEGGGQFVRAPAPLLFGVALDERLVDIPPHQREGALLCILGLFAGDALRGHLALCLLGSNDAPERMEGIHIEGQMIEPAAIVGERAVDVGHKLPIGVDVLPHLSVRGMKDVRAVAVHRDAAVVLRIAVAADVGAAVDDEALFAPLDRLGGEHRPEQPRTDDEKVVWSHSPNFTCLHKKRYAAVATFPRSFQGRALRSATLGSRRTLRQSAISFSLSSAHISPNACLRSGVSFAVVKK